MTDQLYAKPNHRWTIPETWAWAVASEIAQIIGGGTPSTTDSQNFEDGEIPWITPADLTNYREKMIRRGERNITEKGLRNSGARLMPAGTVLFSSRAPIGYVAIADNPVATNQGFKSFIPSEAVTSDYLYYYMQFAKPIAKEMASGTTFLEISGAKAAQIPIPVAPLREQNEIVAEIEKQFTRLDAATAALKRVQANLKRYCASVLKAACEGRLVPTEAELARKEGRDYEPADKLLQRILRERRARWEAEAIVNLTISGKPPKDQSWKQKYKEPCGPDTSSLTPLPNGWCWASLEQLSWSSDYGTSAKCGYDAEGVPVLRIPNIQGGRIDLSDLKRAVAPFPIRDGDGLGPGDLLIIRTNGSRNLIGRCALVNRQLETPTLHASYLIRFRTVVIGAWLSAIWDSSINREKLEEFAATSAGQYNLSMSELANLVLPIPPLAEIHRLCTKLESLNANADRIEKAIETELLHAGSLRSSILTTAFTGQLVPQDRTDEPASALLERIRAGRVESSKKTAARNVARKRGRR